VKKEIPTLCVGLVVELNSDRKLHLLVSKEGTRQVAVVTIAVMIGDQEQQRGKWFYSDCKSFEIRSKFIEDRRDVAVHF